MSDRRALMGAMSGAPGEGFDIDWVNVTEVTVGANSVSNVAAAKEYFQNDYSPFYIVLKESPAHEQQLVFEAINPSNGNLQQAARCVGGAIVQTGTTASYTAYLVEGTHYYVFEIK